MNYSLTANDIIHQQEQNSRKKVYIYKKVLDKCYKRIKFTAKKDEKWCFYTVPNYIVGDPLYDINSCIVYVIKN